MMLMLLAAAQVDRVAVAILDMQADGGLVELAAGVEVGDVEHGMAGADDVERRIEDMFRNGHGRFLIALFPEDARLEAEFLYLVRAPREGDMLGFHVEIERVVA